MLFAIPFIYGIAAAIISLPAYIPFRYVFRLMGGLQLPVDPSEDHISTRSASSVDQ